MKNVEPFRDSAQDLCCTMEVTMRMSYVVTFTTTTTTTMLRNRVLLFTVLGNYCDLCMKHRFFVFTPSVVVGIMRQ